MRLDLWLQQLVLLVKLCQHVTCQFHLTRYNPDSKIARSLLVLLVQDQSGFFSQNNARVHGCGCRDDFDN